MRPEEWDDVLAAREAERAEAREEFIRDLARDPERQAERRARGMPGIEQLQGYVPPERVGDVLKQRMDLARLRAGTDAR